MSKNQPDERHIPSSVVFGCKDTTKFWNTQEKLLKSYKKVKTEDITGVNLNSEITIRVLGYFSLKTARFCQNSHFFCIFCSKNLHTSEKSSTFAPQSR